MSELAQQLEAWGRNNVAHQEGRDWHEFLGLVASVEGLDERLAEEQREHSKLAAASCKPNEIRCIYCDATVCTEPDAPSPEDTLTTRVKSVEHDAACESNPLAARVRELERTVDCGQDGPCAAKAPGCNRHWEERNRELVNEARTLTKRVAELEDMKEKRGAELWSAAQEHYDARRVLEKRVAELDEKVTWRDKLLEQCQTQCTDREKRLSVFIDGLERQVKDLQSQLAWTPVTQGLPRPEDKWILLLANSDDPELPWKQLCAANGQWDDGYGNTPADYTEDGYDVFRRITLPEAT